MLFVRKPKHLFTLMLSVAVFAACLAGDAAAQDRNGQNDRLKPTAQEAARFLQHATWGPTWYSIDHVRDVGFERFLQEQFEAPPSGYYSFPAVPNNAPDSCDSACRRQNYSLYELQTRFFRNALYGDDQLRQRVAFALHQIFVVAGSGIGNQPSRMAPYLQMLDRNAFGNVRQLIEDVTLNPAMGNYLDMAGNRKANGANLPNENYAREVLQLFSIGLTRLNPDGTPQRDDQGRTMITYDQAIVNAFARVFTGWNYAPQRVQGTTNYAEPMVATQNNHDTDAKTLLRGVQLPARQTAAADLKAALDNIFLDPNLGPFLGRQLIQHLVTSTPSPAYVSRITQVFNDNGNGVRGDLKAVVSAILLDPEALAAPSNSTVAHLMHPALFVTSLLRAFEAKSADKTTLSDGYLNPQTQGMGMDIFNPPSVFSYFSPFGSLPGSSGTRAPEFGVLNTSTAVSRVNFVNTMVFSSIGVSNNAPQGTSLDFSALQYLAGNPAGLVDTLNVLMLNGTMSAEMRTAVIDAVRAVGAGNSLKRVRTAAYLIATSAQFQVER
jgi:uncharacterized protein (DUF1800 family)